MSVHRDTNQSGPKVPKATRTPTEIGQTVPTSPKGEAQKAAALRAVAKGRPVSVVYTPPTTPTAAPGISATPTKTARRRSPAPPRRAVKLSSYEAPKAPKAVKAILAHAASHPDVEIKLGAPKLKAPKIAAPRTRVEARAKARREFDAVAKPPKVPKQAGQKVENPKIQGPKERKVAAKLKKAVKRSVTIQGPLSRDQKTFAKQLSKTAGVSPAFAAAAVLREGGSNTPGDQNWLNIGRTDSGATSITDAPEFSDPRSAGKATGKWLKGKFGSDYNYVAAPAIQAITEQKGDQAQGEAWANSGWASSGASPLDTIDQVSASTKPIPKAVKKKATATLGKAKTKAILRGPKAETVSKQPGKWAGSQHAVLSLIPKGVRAEGRGDKRTPAENSSVGGGADSDHLTTNEAAYAADIPVDPEVYALLRKELGLPAGPTTGEDTVTKDGYRYQLIYGAQYDHADHIHLGAEWTGEDAPPGTVLGGPATTTLTSAPTSGAPAATTSTAAPKRDSQKKRRARKRRSTKFRLSGIPDPVEAAAIEFTTPTYEDYVRSAATPVKL